MKKFLIFIILCSVSLMCYAQSNDTTKWYRVAQNNYIDIEGIVGIEDLYGYSFLLKSYNKGQYEPINGHEILYTLNQYTIDCETMKYKLGMIDSYGYKNEFLNGDYNKYAQFQPIVTGTAISNIANKLCK